MSDPCPARDLDLSQARTRRWRQAPLGSCTRWIDSDAARDSRSARDSLSCSMCKTRWVAESVIPVFDIGGLLWGQRCAQELVCCSMRQTCRAAESVMHCVRTPLWPNARQYRQGALQHPGMLLCLTRRVSLRFFLWRGGSRGHSGMHSMHWTLIPSSCLACLCWRCAPQINMRVPRGASRAGRMRLPDMHVAYCPFGPYWRLPCQLVGQCSPRHARDTPPSDTFMVFGLPYLAAFFPHACAACV